jgi:hypothetical protein
MLSLACSFNEQVCNVVRRIPHRDHEHDGQYSTNVMILRINIITVCEKDMGTVREKTSRRLCTATVTHPLSSFLSLKRFLLTLDYLSTCVTTWRDFVVSDQRPVRSAEQRAPL